MSASSYHPHPFNDGSPGAVPASIDVQARLSRSFSGIRRLQSDESWVEISNQPSSSSITSIAAGDANQQNLRQSMDPAGLKPRRPLLRNAVSGPVLTGRPTSAATSSQEEYEESESESDHIMTSSNENIELAAAPHRSIEIPSSDSDDALLKHRELAQSRNAQSQDQRHLDHVSAKDATSAGIMNDQPVFTPPANIFSHPPQSSTRRNVRSMDMHTNYFANDHNSGTRPHPIRAYSNRERRASHTPYNMISPSHQIDHDAALRASLTTLLSCAAAARGLPKKDAFSTDRPLTQRQESHQVQASTLQIVSEEDLICGPEPDSRPEQAHWQRALQTRENHNTIDLQSMSSSARLSASDVEKTKRKATVVAKDRTSKKARRAKSPPPLHEQSAPINEPTLMTWVVSAGVVVLFSAISFSAGYALGREVSQWEALQARPGGAGSSSGRAIEGILPAAEQVLGSGGNRVSRGLRRLRWTGVSSMGSLGGAGGIGSSPIMV